MDSGQFAVSTGMCCQRTPEPSRVVVQFHRTTVPPRAHLWAMFLCDQKGGSAGGSPAKRLTRLTTVDGSASRGSQTIRLTRWVTVNQGEDEIFATMDSWKSGRGSPQPLRGERGSNASAHRLRSKKSARTVRTTVLAR